MLKIIACFKWVVDDADIKVDAASRKLNLDRAGYKISAYDRNAIEEAVRLHEKHGGSISAITVAPPGAKPCLKDALSRGPDEACFINDPCCADLEPSQTIDVLASAIGKQDFDLILCGEGSGDIYAQQVGPGLAEKLGIPCATWVNKLTFDEDGKKIVAERKLEDGIETVEIPLPALVAVLPDINSPRIPTLKQVLGAAKKPVNATGPEKVPEARLRTASVLAAAMDRKRIKFSADADGVREAVSALLREGVIS